MVTVKNNVVYVKNQESKYKKCTVCGLKIRAKSIEAHEKGWSHNHRGFKYQK